MRRLWQKIQLYPARFQAVIYSGISLGMAFGLDITAEQLAQVMVFTAAVLTFLTEKVVAQSGHGRG